MTYNKNMFGLFKKKSATKNLEEQYAQLQKEAMNLQRGGDIKGFALKTAEAEDVWTQIQQEKTETS